MGFFVVLEKLNDDDDNIIGCNFIYFLTTDNKLLVLSKMDLR